MSVQLRSETPADRDAIRHVHDRAFGQPGEGKLVDALRNGGYARLSLVAELDQRIVGHVLFSDLPIVTASDTVAALSLAPLAVLPEYQGRGVGTALVRRGLEDCRAQGHRIVVVLGYPHYYGRFGFTGALAAALDSPYAGPHFQAVELVPGALAGVIGQVRYPPPFSEL